MARRRGSLPIFFTFAWRHGRPASRVLLRMSITSFLTHWWAIALRWSSAARTTMASSTDCTARCVHAMWWRRQASSSGRRCSRWMSISGTWTRWCAASAIITSCLLHILLVYCLWLGGFHKRAKDIRHLLCRGRSKFVHRPCESSGESIVSRIMSLDFTMSSFDRLIELSSCISKKIFPSLQFVLFLHELLCEVVAMLLRVETWSP